MIHHTDSLGAAMRDLLTGRTAVTDARQRPATTG